MGEPTKSWPHPDGTIHTTQCEWAVNYDPPESMGWLCVCSECGEEHLLSYDDLDSKQQVKVDKEINAKLEAEGRKSHYERHKAVAQVIPDGDYVHIVCAKCQQLCFVHYLGLDPSIPLLKITCPSHGPIWSGKLEGARDGWHESFRGAEFDKGFVQSLIDAGYYEEKDGVVVPYIGANGVKFFLQETELGWKVDRD